MKIYVTYKRRGEDGIWNLLFRRGLFAWEEEEELQRLNHLLTAGPCTQLVAEMQWYGEQLQTIFPLSNLYMIFWNQKALGSGGLCIAVMCKWRNVATPRVQFFGWLTRARRVKTSSLLSFFFFFDDPPSLLSTMGIIEDN